MSLVNAGGTIGKITFAEIWKKKYKSDEVQFLQV
jgi:hypothetical protein